MNLVFVLTVEILFEIVVSFSFQGVIYEEPLCDALITTKCLQESSWHFRA